MMTTSHTGSGSGLLQSETAYNDLREHLLGQLASIFNVFKRTPFKEGARSETIYKEMKEIIDNRQEASMLSVAINLDLRDPFTVMTKLKNWIEEDGRAEGWAFLKSDHEVIRPLLTLWRNICEVYGSIRDIHKMKLEDIERKKQAAEKKQKEGKESPEESNPVAELTRQMQAIQQQNQERFVQLEQSQKKLTKENKDLRETADAVAEFMLLLRKEHQQVYLAIEGKIPEDKRKFLALPAPEVAVSAAPQPSSSSVQPQAPSITTMNRATVLAPQPGNEELLKDALIPYVKKDEKVNIGGVFQRRFDLIMTFKKLCDDSRESPNVISQAKLAIRLLLLCKYCNIVNKDTTLGMSIQEVKTYMNTLLNGRFESRIGEIFADVDDQTAMSQIPEGERRAQFTVAEAQRLNRLYGSFLLGDEVGQKIFKDLYDHLRNPSTKALSYKPENYADDFKLLASSSSIPQLRPS